MDENENKEDDENEDEKQALERAGLSLSFRLVNDIDFSKHTFKFYGFTNISKPAEEITISIYLLNGETKIPTPVESKCTLETSVPDGISLYPVSYLCALPDNTEYDSFEISSSDDIAGFPTNDTLLNPNKTQAAIDKGIIKIDVSDVENITTL